MTQEEKQILFRDLCGRLPYHVRCKVWLEDGTTEEGPLDLEHNYGNVLQDAFYYNDIKDIKPYLRPMSSITDDELKELRKECPHAVFNPKGAVTSSWILGIDGSDHGRIAYINEAGKILEFCYSHHLDCHRLIEDGLAIEVTKDNNPYKDIKL